MILIRSMAQGACAALALLTSGCASSPERDGPVQSARLDPAGLEEAVANGDYPETTGVLVMRGEATLHESYFGGGASGRLNDTRSLTKTIVAMAVGAAIADGAIASVDAIVWPLFQDMAPNVSPLAREMTFRDLLTMTASRHCDDNNDTPGNEENMYPEESWTAFFWGLPDQPQWSRDDDGLGSWRYCTAGSFILGQAVARAVGEPIDDYIARKIFAPLGVEEAQWDRSPSGEAQTGGGLELTLFDLGKLARLLRDEGAFEGVQILPTDWVTEMTTAYRSAFEDLSYGYQIWTRAYPAPCGAQVAWLMAGNGGNHALIFRDLDLVVVVTREAYNTRNMHQQSMALVERHILPAVCG